MKESIKIAGRDYIFSTPDSDAEFLRIVELNEAVHGPGVSALCRALDGNYPGMSRDDWYAVTAPGSDRALSTLCRIPTTWLYRAGTPDRVVEVPLKAAELSIVATAEDARGLGLSGWLIRRYAKDSAALGFTVSTIEGIPYFYRRFGYEYAAPLCVQRRLGPGMAPRPDNARDSWRPGVAAVRAADLEPSAGLSFSKAVPADIPVLSRLYDADNAGLGLCARRDRAQWDYLMGASLGSPETAVDRFVMERGGQALGYLGLGVDGFGPGYALMEAAIDPAVAGAERRGVAFAIVREAELERERRKAAHLVVALPRSHEVSRLAEELGADDRWEYGWQVSIMDPVGFCRLVAPALQARLASSDWKGRPYRLSLDLFGETLGFRWDGAALAVTGSAAGDEAAAGGASGGGNTDAEFAAAAGGASEGAAEGNGRLPPELLAPLAFGYRSLAELRSQRHDVSVYGDAEAFLDALFPRLDSFAYCFI